MKIKRTIFETIATIIATGVVAIGAAWLPTHMQSKQIEKVLLLEKSEKISYSLAKASSIIYDYTVHFDTNDCDHKSDIQIAQEEFSEIGTILKHIRDNNIYKSNNDFNSYLDDLSKKQINNIEIIEKSLLKGKDEFKEYWSNGYKIHYDNIHLMILYFPNLYPEYKKIAGYYGRIGQLYSDYITTKDICTNKEELKELELLLEIFEPAIIKFHAQMSLESRK